MKHLITSKGKPVITGKFYNLKYLFGDYYRYGYGWINPQKENQNTIDIICHDGGVTIQSVENVVFINQIKQ